MQKLRFPLATVSFRSVVSLDSTLGEGVKIFDNVRIGGCHIASFSYIGSNSKLARTTIGPFTSIGADVICGLGSHPIDFVSTYPGFYSKNASGSVWFGNVHDFEDKKNVHIGADVWIGTRAIILDGISVGHGAIIGAAAVVTKNVPPYAVVVGVPAKIIKYRFNKELCEKLTESEWWKLTKEELKNASIYMDDPEHFLEMIKKHK